MAAQDPPVDDGQVAALRREAADRRKKLREVEAERDGLRARVDAHDRQHVEALAAEHLADSRDCAGVSRLKDPRSGR